MAAQKGALQSADDRPFEMGPPVGERASLEPEPKASIVEFYFLTAAAERAWAAINARRAGGGALFWIGGPAGAGKTHFLNYVLALEERAGVSAGRRAIVTLQTDDTARAGALEQLLIEGLTREIGADGREAALWRRMSGAQALALALGHARRVGIRSVSIAIDLGATDTAGMDNYFNELSRRIAAARDPVMNVLVAARAPAPEGARALDVAPANAEERILAAMARARRVTDRAAALALYQDVDCGGFEPQAIFPFHPRTLRTLLAVADSPARVAALGDMIADVLNDRRERGADTCERPLLPLDLLQAVAVTRCVDDRLGEDGRAAMAIAHRAAETMRDRTRAHGVVDALMLEALSSGAALPVRDLNSLLPAELHADGADGSSLPQLLAAISSRSSGVVIFDGRGARFDAHAVHAAEVAGFNAAMPLIRRFDATLGVITQPSELAGKLRRLDGAMRNAREDAYRVAAALEAAERDNRGDPAPAYRQTLDEFNALAAGGARALVALGADPVRRAETMRTVAAYEDLAMAAAAAARMRMMREYLRATGLRPDFVRDGPGDRTDAALVVECQLLLAALDAGVLPDAQRRFEALEARFEKFKWTYLAAYREAHARWRRDCERMVAGLVDARGHFAALARLNSIVALGAPDGAELGVRIEELARGIGRCDGDAPTGPESARCAGCGFVLGTQLPEVELGEVFEQVRRALRGKLAALSRGAISRLIRTHDRGHRLEGFLKITQAANTEALVRVLDDNLAAYLAQLLREVNDEAISGGESSEGRPRQTGAPPTVVRRIEPRRAVPDSPRAKRRAKPRSDKQ